MSNFKNVFRVSNNNNNNKYKEKIEFNRIESYLQDPINWESSNSICNCMAIEMLMIIIWMVVI